MITSSPLLNVMSAAAIKAGKGLLRDFNEVDQLQISRKGTANFVTASDLRTEKTLQRELSKARPDFGFLLEEGGEVPGKDATHRWIVDPLDGTSNFIHAVSYFCISIALEKREANGKSDIIAAVVFDPIHNELFMAEKGKGATLNGRRLSVSKRDNIEESMLVVGNPRFAPEGHDPFALLDTMTQCGAMIRYFGATALDIANLAAGRYDACWYYNAQAWDLAAGMLLLKEAGGIVTDLNGRSADCYSKAVLCSNGQLHLPVQKLLANVA